MTKTVKNSDRRRCSGAKIVKKVDKEGSGRIVGGMDQQDGAGQTWRGNLAPKSGPRAHMRRVERKPPKKSGAWMAVFLRGFLQHVDRPRAP